MSLGLIILATVTDSCLESSHMCLARPLSVTLTLKHMLSHIDCWRGENLSFLTISVLSLYSKHKAKYITLHTDCHRVLILRKSPLKGLREM